MSWGKTKDVEVKAYKTPSGEEIKIKDKVKDLGVLKSADLRFREHINETISSWVFSFLLRRFFECFSVLFYTLLLHHSCAP